MLEKVLSKNSSIIISTGNVLSVNKKPGQKPELELIDCLKATIADPATSTYAEITRQNDDLHSKITEHERNNIKIGAKIFINKNSEENLKTAIDNLFKILNIDYLDNLILAYHPRGGCTIDGNGVGETNGVAHVNGDSKEGVIEWGGKNKYGALNDLKLLWKDLEQYAEEKKIKQLGIADLDYESLQSLYSECKIHPAIVQINLSACCVVPPALQEFCNKKDIQLLTHSDPEEILTQTTLTEIGVVPFQPIWSIRYQIHVKCRGLLTAKGFVVGVERT